MKALVLHQPWASLMAIGAKINETRSWPIAYRGDLAICAAKAYWRNNVPGYAENALMRLWSFRDKFPGYHGNVKDLYDSLPFGMVTCVVTKTNCLSTNDDNGDDRSLTALELDLGNYSADRFYCPTTNLRKLIELVPVKGRQGLFNLSDSEAESVRCQLQQLKGW